MKKITTGIVLMMFLTFGASAQEKHKGHHGRHNAKTHRQYIIKDLNLSDEQKQRLKSIRENYRTQMVELNKNESITVKEMRNRKASLAKERKSAVEGILTAEQKAKIDDQRKQSIEKRKEMQAKRAEKMKKDLALTDDQSSKLKAMNESYSKKFESLMKNESLDRTIKRDQFKALKKEQKEELKNVLTQEQIQKLEEMKRNKSGRRAAK